MIVKSYSTAKLDIIKNPYILLYGINEGAKKIEINKLLKNIEKNKIAIIIKKVLILSGQENKT